MFLTSLIWTLACAASVLGDDSLFWGPYRSNLYFGMRPRVPHSLLTSLMWFNSEDYGSIQQLRHEAKMEDSIKSFGWSQYDPRLGGIEVIRDEGNKVNITIELVKSEDGLSWAARIKGDQSPDNVQTIVYSAALEGDGKLDLESQLSVTGIKGDVKLAGQSPDLGRFTLTVSDGFGERPSSLHPSADDHPAELTQYTQLNVPADNVWKAKDIYLMLAQDVVNIQAAKFEHTQSEYPIPPWAVVALDNSDKFNGDFHLMQKTFQGPFEFDIVYNARKSTDKIESSSISNRVDKILKSQKEKFNNAFSLEAPFNTPKYQKFASELISNVLGGIGYFYGDSLVGNPDERSQVATVDAKSLFTSTPTRAFFPRGFYWDEGFHLLTLVDYDLSLVLEIVSSWFALMDEDGWIAREQILGPEARSRVPEEFQVQFPDYANPPTLMMLLAYVASAKQTPDSIAKLNELYPDLERHFKWFRSSQRGELLEFDRDPPSRREAYRWRGRTPTHVLTSGMDDYPRASDPNEGELHVDLLSWVGSMSRSLNQIAEILGKEKDVARYSKIEEDVKKNLIALHWDKQHQTFCDVTIDDFEEDSHACHIGYVTQLPFMLRLIDTNDSEKLLAALQLFRDEAGLWSPFGIRSLSRQDQFFGTEENYWRGPVWLNMNFLTLDALKYYAENGARDNVRELAAEVYHDLRLNLVNNVYNKWVETGYVWEQYDSLTGEQKGAKQFTGWTALVANIMRMPETVGDAPIAKETRAEVEETAEEAPEVTENEDILVQDDDEEDDLHDEL